MYFTSSSSTANTAEASVYYQQELRGFKKSRAVFVTSETLEYSTIYNPASRPPYIHTSTTSHRTSTRSMGILKRLTALSATTTAAFYYISRDTRFAPLATDTDPLFQSAYYRRFNALANPTTHDLCVQRVPARDVDPELLAAAKATGGGDGRLVEAFCGSVWGGLGSPITPPPSTPVCCVMCVCLYVGVK